MSIGYVHGYNERDHSRHVSSRFVFLKNKACEDERHPITWYIFSFLPTFVQNPKEGEAIRRKSGKPSTNSWRIAILILLFLTWSLRLSVTSISRLRSSRRMLRIILVIDHFRWWHVCVTHLHYHRYDAVSHPCRYNGYHIKPFNVVSQESIRLNFRCVHEVKFCRQEKAQVYHTLSSSWSFQAEKIKNDIILDFCY